MLRNEQRGESGERRRRSSKPLTGRFLRLEPFRAALRTIS